MKKMTKYLVNSSMTGQKTPMNIVLGLRNYLVLD